MHDSTSRDALERSIRARLPTCAHDELRVIDLIITRLAIGREKYGALTLATDRRDFVYESVEELTDCLFYLAAAQIAQGRRDRATQFDLGGEG